MQPIFRVFASEKLCKIVTLKGEKEIICQNLKNLSLYIYIHIFFFHLKKKPLQQISNYSGFLISIVNLFHARHAQCMGDE